MNPRNLFAELKQLNVYKVAISCAVLAWFAGNLEEKLTG